MTSHNFKLDKVGIQIKKRCIQVNCAYLLHSSFLTISSFHTHNNCRDCVATETETTNISEISISCYSFIK